MAIHTPGTVALERIACRIVGPIIPTAADVVEALERRTHGAGSVLGCSIGRDIGQHRYRIQFCPTHAAAADALDALRDVVKAWEANLIYMTPNTRRRCAPAIERARAVLGGDYGKVG